MADPLPGWDAMPDPDRGVAVAHLHHCHVYTTMKARHRFPARYRQHPALTGLSVTAANDHARSMWPHVRDLSEAEWLRLIDLVEARPGNPNPPYPCAPRPTAGQALP